MKVIRKIMRDPLILPVYLPSLMGAFSSGLLVPIIPLYIVSFDVSYGLVGLALASQSIGTMLCDVPSGLLLRKFGVKRSMLVGIAFITLSTFALYWSTNIIEVIALRLSSGLGMALYGIARHNYIAETIVINYRGRASALFGGVNRVGKFTGPAIGGFVAAAFGLQTVFILFSAVFIFIFIIVTVVVDEKYSASIKSTTLHGNSIYKTLKSEYRILLTAGLGQLFAQMIRAGVIVVIPLYAAEVIGLKVEVIGLIVSIAAAVDMSLFYPAGLLMDRLGRKYAIIPCFFIQAVGLGLLPFTDSYNTLLIVAVLISIGNGLGSGTMLTLGTDFAPENSRAEFLSLWRFIHSVGQTGAPVLIGTVAAIITMQAAVWSISATGLLAVFIFAFHVPETLKRK